MARAMKHGFLPHKAMPQIGVCAANKVQKRSNGDGGAGHGRERKEDQSGGGWIVRKDLREKHLSQDDVYHRGWWRRMDKKKSTSNKIGKKCVEK